MTMRCTSSAAALLLATLLLARCTCTEPSPLTPGEGVGEGEGEGEGEDEGEGEGEPPSPGPCVVVALGANLPDAVEARIPTLIFERAGNNVERVQRTGSDTSAIPSTCAPAETPVFIFGDHPWREQLISTAERDAVGPEGYILRTSSIRDGERTFVAAATDGTPAIANRTTGHTKPSPGGPAFGSYALLEQVLGFAFLHPLAPTLPTTLATTLPAVDVTTAPRWQVRNMHLHTQHPLELTEFLQGMGVDGADDEAGFESMLPEWERFLEWMVANGQNEVEWILLEAASFSDFAQSDTRRERLRRIVDTCHAWGVACGVDAPIVFQQQHTWRLIRDLGDRAVESAQLRERIDWLMGIGFDFLGTESGSTEFTNPGAERMLSWMDEMAIYLDETYDKEVMIKVHCSTGQAAEPFVDRTTGEPLNFNFLPTYADRRMGVMPHTVQINGLDDPAPTYGNTDFGYIRDFLHEEAGKRLVVWYPETAYWVSYDVDVPLFLPVYAERRVADLQLLADDEDLGLMGRGAEAGARMDGQVIFSSGWEWGYWLNDVVAARASWDPFRGEDTPQASMRAILAPLSRVLGSEGPAIVAELARLATVQRAVLLYGDVDGTRPDDVVRRNGIAYLAGLEAFDDVLDVARSTGLADATTQPDRLGLVEMRNPLRDPPAYTGEIDLLLAHMVDVFGASMDALDGFSADGPGADLFDELKDAQRITLRRAEQLIGLYDFVDRRLDFDQTRRRQSLAAARAALDDAAAIVARREARYRVPVERIAAWRDNPTCYAFTYLWTVHSLHYWWRDEGKAIDAPASPCYLNIIDPANTALGEGLAQDTAELVRNLTDGDFLSGATGCLAAPAIEPTYPQDTLRSRP